MLKRTVVFSAGGYLSTKHRQLSYRSPSTDNPDEQTQVTMPMEDLGVVVLESDAITITAKAMQGLVASGAALVCCDSSHTPSAMLLPLDGNSTLTEVFRYQVAASRPLSKQLWQQIVQAKIRNQAAVLRHVNRGQPDALETMVKRVKSGDTDNREAVAARLYWDEVFGIEEFRRQREGGGANGLLNYGYAIVRAACARALVSSGLNCALGIHHSNKYNAFCLADDIMEPFRPFVDREVNQCFNMGSTGRLTKTEKQILLNVLRIDVECGSVKRPLMNAISLCTASLVRCFKGETKDLVLPVLV